MKTIRILLWAIIAIQLIATSCKKENSSTIEKDSLAQQQDIIVEDGYLSFKNDSVFRKTANDVLSKNQQELDSWERQFSGFKSYRKIFNEIQNDFERVSNQGEFVKFKSDYGTSVLINADTSISYKFGTPLLAIFTNKEGEFRIGNKMYLITEDNKLISFPIELKASSHSVRKSTISDKANGIEVRYYKAEKASKNPSVSSALWEPFNGIVKQELRYSGSRRLYIEIWRECIPSSDHPNDPDYFNYYLKLLQQSKKIWGWDANNTNYHMTDGRFKYQYAITTWGVPTVYTLETVPKETVNTMLEEYNNYDIRGAVYIGLFSGYNFGSFIGINALISSGGVPHNDSRYTFSNTYPSTLP